MIYSMLKVGVYCQILLEFAYQLLYQKKKKNFIQSSPSLAWGLLSNFICVPIIVPKLEKNTIISFFTC